MTQQLDGVIPDPYAGLSTTLEVAAKLHAAPIQIDDLAGRLNIGELLGGFRAFTAHDVEQLRKALRKFGR